MHRGCDFFRSWAQWALILAGVGLDARAAQVVPSLYGAVVSDSDGQQAAQDAMRQVLFDASAHGGLGYRYQAGP
jgi:hypothetical protein